jgi:hypothetical protein
MDLLVNYGIRTSSAGIPIVTDGLILHLDAGNTSSYPGSGTTWFDLSGNNNHGTLNGLAYNSDNNGFFSFSGNISSNVDLGSPSSLRVTTGSTTHCFWIRTTIGTAGFMGLAGNGTGGAVRASNMYVYDGPPYGVHLTHGPGPASWGGSVSSNFLNNNVWNFVCGVIDNTTQRHRYYLNGNLIETLASSPTAWQPVQAATDTYYIGRADNYFSGDIAETHRYNRPLSTAEIAQNFNATKTRFGL